MKAIKFLLMLIALVTSLTDCSEIETSVNPVPEQNKPEPTPKGVPIGVPVSKIIGANGGTLFSLDALMGVEIPAGALSADTEITIQPITNFAPNGNGNAYQLSPEGIKFNKPVKITFKHGKEVSATVPPLTGIAFQDEAGFWYSPGNFTWDEARKTVSTETTHFSPWGSFDELKIISNGVDKKFDKYGNPIYQLKVNEVGDFVLVAIESYIEGSEDLSPLSPGVEPHFAHLLTIIIHGKQGVRVKEWSVNGDKNGSRGIYGTIKVSGEDSLCKYTAPPKMPAASKNPVQLSVNLRNLKYERHDKKEVLDDLMVSVQIEIVGEFKFNLEVKYKDPNVNPGVESPFTLEDKISLKVIVRGTVVTIPGEVDNFPGTVSPAVFTSELSKCTTTWIPPIEGFLGPLNVSRDEVRGTVIELTYPNGEVKNFLNLSFETKSQFPKWKFQCPNGNPFFGGGESGEGQFDMDFVLKDSIQSLDQAIYFATITPEK